MQFDDFLEQLSKTNSTLGSFVDFDKVNRNVDKISIKLNQLNYLIGKDDLEEAVETLFNENRQCFAVLNILIAVRDNKQVIDNVGDFVSLNSYQVSPKKIYEYIVDTGLSEILKNKNIKNLVDYVFGVEVGLDTNARKNRGGKNMEQAVANVFTANNISFESEVKHTNFPELTSFGEDIKRFDFVIKTSATTYLIETNYYNAGGSKLNEVARAYTDLAPKINQFDGFEFVWITDGQGWFSAKNKLEEAYGKIPKVYNLTTISEFVDIVKKEMTNNAKNIL